MDDNENKLEIAEKIFEKYGAKPLDLNKKNREKFGERRIFFYQDNYYRVGRLITGQEEEQYMVVSCIDNEKFAAVGMLEDIDAIPFSADEAEIEKKIRMILGLDQYTEN